MIRELLPIIGRDAVAPIRQWCEQGNSLVAHSLCSLANLRPRKSHSGLSFRQGDKYMDTTRTKQRVDLPISRSKTVIYGFGTLFNTDSIGYYTPAIMAAAAFSALLPAMEMSIQVAARMLVFKNVLVNPFMADMNIMLSLQTSRDLFRARRSWREATSLKKPRAVLGRHPIYRD